MALLCHVHPLNHVPRAPNPHHNPFTRGLPRTNSREKIVLRRYFNKEKLTGSFFRCTISGRKGRDQLHSYTQEQKGKGWRHFSWLCGEAALGHSCGDRIQMLFLQQNSEETIGKQCVQYGDNKKEWLQYSVEQIIKVWVMRAGPAQ